MKLGSGILEPTELDLVRNVFKRVATNSSFKNDIPSLNRFGLIVLHAYQGGIVDQEQLYEHSLAASKNLPMSEHPY